MKIAELFESQKIKQRLDPKCWTGWHKEGTKIKGGVRVNNCVKNEDVDNDKSNKSTLHGDVTENFADGQGPGRPGDSQQHGIPKNATLAQLDNIGKGSGRKAQLARWQANMRRGRSKTK